jgi:hypothetical protein
MIFSAAMPAANEMKTDNENRNVLKFFIKTSKS